MKSVGDAKLGGLRRAALLSPDERKASASRAARARWDKVRLTPVSERKTPLDRALDAVKALAVATLESPSPTRFHDAAAICDLGQKLTRQLSKRAADFDDDDDDAVGGYAVRPRRGRHRAWLGEMENPVLAGGLVPNDEQARRDLALAAGPMVQSSTEAVRAQWAASEAKELADLLGVKDHLEAQSHLDALEGKARRDADPFVQKLTSLSLDELWTAPRAIRPATMDRLTRSGVKLKKLVDLVKKEKHQVRQLRGVGRETVDDLDSALGSLDLWFGMKPGDIARWERPNATGAPAETATGRQLKIIHARIETLTRAMEARNASTAVVSADVSRRHPTGSEGRVDPRVRERDHAVGGGGTEGPP